MRKTLVGTVLLALTAVLVLALIDSSPMESGTPRGPAVEAKLAPEQPPGGPPKLEDYVDWEGEGQVEFRPRNDWARKSFQVAGLSSQAGGPYRKGVSPEIRPFDDSDPQMRALMGEVYAVGGCAQPGQPCEPAHQRMKQGGDRLAAYLIEQFERTIQEGYPDRYTYLSLIAYTESETGFHFIRERVRNRQELPMPEQRHAVRALSHTAHPEAIDIALDLIDDPDKGIRTSAVNTLWRVPIATGVLREDVREVLLELREREWRSAMWAISRLSEHFDLGLEEPLD